MTQTGCDGSVRVTLALTAAPDILANPTDIALVLDRSGSMSGAPLASMKEGAKTFIDIISEATGGAADGLIGSGSRIGIVSFAATATADTQLITSVATLKASVDALSAGGNTNHADAFSKAIALFDPASANHRALTAEIRKAKQIANGAGMVAINAMVATQDYAAAIRTAVEAGVDAVVSGAGLPLELPGLVNTMEVAIAPIVSSGRAAKLILRRWAKEFGRTADFVVIEGCKAGGHLGFAEQDLFSGTCQTLDEILPEVLAEVKPYEAQFGHSIPVFVAGGVYTGADLAHFTRLGAAGVQLATRFITTYECDASQGYKDVLLNAGSEVVRIIHSPVGMPGRALNTPLVQAMAEGRRFPPRHCARCLKTCDPVKVPYCITHALIEAVKGNLEEGLFFCGANVGRLDRMYTVRELMDELVTEWRQNR